VANNHASDDAIRERITRILERSPNISVSMMIPHVRPYRRDWRSVLEQMIADGTVVRESIPNGSVRMSFVHRLAEPTSATAAA
jgi:hypothetical protein